MKPVPLVSAPLSARGPCSFGGRGGRCSSNDGGVFAAARDALGDLGPPWTHPDPSAAGGSRRAGPGWAGSPSAGQGPTSHRTGGGGGLVSRNGDGTVGGRGGEEEWGEDR